MAGSKELTTRKRLREDPQDDSDEAAEVFDAETGALSRPFKSFRPASDAKRRGYGRTKALDDHPLLHPQIIIIAAPTGGGKTTLALNLVEEVLEHVDQKKLGKVMYYSGSPGDVLLRKLDQDTVDMYGPDKVEALLSDLRTLNMYDETVKHVPNPAGGAPDDEIPEHRRPLHVLVLDDAANNKDLMPNNAKGSEIGDIMVSHRHRGLLMILCTQKFNATPTFARANASHIFAFPGSPAENKQVLSGVPMGTAALEQSFKTLARQPHGFLWLNLKRRTGMEGFTKVVAQ